MQGETKSAWWPKIYHDTQAYWDGCTRRELIIARCGNCGRWQHPPRAVCPACWSDDMRHEKVSGRATVYTFTALGNDRPGVSESRVTVWAELVEQLRLIVVADLVGGGAGDIAIGDKLELDWRDLDGLGIPIFRKAE